MELKRYEDVESIPFGNLVVRDLTPHQFAAATVTEVEVPIGGDNPPYAPEGEDRVYIGVTGEIEFAMNGTSVRIGPGDVLVIHAGEQFRYHNGGYEPGRLFVIQMAKG